MTYECRVCQDNLCFIRQDVELDDVAVTVSVDDFRVCGETMKKKREIMVKQPPPLTLLRITKVPSKTILSESGCIKLNKQTGSCYCSFD